MSGWRLRAFALGALVGAALWTIPAALSFEPPTKHVGEWQLKRCRTVELGGYSNEECVPVEPPRGGRP